MRWLWVDLGELSLRLPLCDSSSSELESVLLCEKASIAQRLQHLFVRDPVVALWAFWSLSNCGSETNQPGTLDQLAAALSANLLPLLSRGLEGLADDPAETEHGRIAVLDDPPSRSNLHAGSPAKTTDLISTCAERVGQTVATAELAACLAPEAGGNGEAARFHGLMSIVSALADLGAAGGTSTSVGDEGIEHHDFAELAPPLPRPDRATTDLLEQARQIVEQEQAPEQSGEAPASWRQAGIDARDAWLHRDPATRVRLPALVARLTRLATLEHRFQSALEEAKLQAVYDLAYGAGHEINNPLTNISVRAQTLLKEETHPERRRVLASINAQAFRAHEMIADLMLFSRPPRPAAELLDLGLVVRLVAERVYQAAHDQGTELHLQSAERGGTVQADAAHVTLAVESLCRNALEALGGGGHVELSLAPHRLADGSRWHAICVRDDGPGISPEARGRLFNPFFSGREAGRGLGFGLPKCWRLIHQQGGRIEVQSALGQGATFSILLPAA